MSAAPSSVTPQQTAAEPAEPSPSAPAHRPTEATLDAASLFGGRDPGIGDTTTFEHALPPFLRALGWSGDRRHVLEALPHFDRVATVAAFRVVLRNLGYASETREMRAQDMARDGGPWLFVDGDAAVVVLGVAADGRLDAVVDGVRAPRSAPLGRVEALSAASQDLAAEAGAPDHAKLGWFWSELRKLSQSFSSVFLLTCVINGLSLLTPLYSMAVYNNVIRSGMTETLAAATALALGAVFLEAHLRGMRGRVLSIAGARLNTRIQLAAFGRILTLPAAMTETASVSMQTSRLKQFEAVLGVFNGPLANAALDLPFMVIFLIVIAMLGGPIVWIPVCLLLLFAALGLILTPAVRRRSAEASQTRQFAQDLVRQTIRGAETLRGLGAERAWMKKLQPALAANLRAKMRQQSHDLLVRSIAQLLTASAAILILATGAYLVMEERLSMGGLIAVMMIVWKVLSPIQSAFLAINQIASTRDAIRQIDALMRLPLERDLDKPPTIYRHFAGGLKLSQVSFRYPRAVDPALRGVSVDIAPGERIGIVGPSGAGKTTLIKLLLRLHNPSAGQIFLDDLNLAQLHPGEVRGAVAYAPERVELFFGTLAQNIRLSHRTAEDADIAACLEELGLAPGCDALPDGLQTRLNAERLASLSAGDLQRIMLARAIVRPAPFLCLDDPLNHLDARAKALLLAALERRRGRQTILIVTNDADALMGCDRIVALVQGAVLVDARPSEALPKIQGLVTRN